MLTTELCARLCADFPLQLPDAPACFACTRVVLDPWDDAEGGTVFIGEGTVDRPDRFYLLCAPGAPQHPNAAHYADPALTLPLVRAVHRLLEPEGSEPDFTRGTLEGDIAASDITFYRLQCDSEGVLRAYVAQGEVLDVRAHSFGGIGVFAIPEMGRFYRHVLVGKRYPHHGAVAFHHVGAALFEVFKFLGVKDIAYNRPASLPYPTENPFA